MPTSDLAGPGVLLVQQGIFRSLTEPSRQEVVNSLGNRFAPLGREEFFLLGNVGHHLGNFVQGLFCVEELLALESITCAQPHVTVLQWQEGDKEVNQVVLHQTAVAKATL